MNFTRRLNREFFYFFKPKFQIWWLISGMEVMKKPKFQLNKIMPAGPKKHRDMGFE